MKRVFAALAAGLAGIFATAQTPFNHTRSTEVVRGLDVLAVKDRFIYRGYARRGSRNKYSGADLRAIRAVNGVGRPPKR